MKSIPNPHPRRLSGFTLFDLVGVLAITGVVAAVTFPVFARAREKATESFCMAGRSQFIRATAAYAEDYDEAWVRSPNSLAPYIRSAVYACPTDTWAGPPRFLETRDVVAHKSHSAGGGHGGSVNMLYHNGSILQSTYTEAIFWGPSWGDSGFVSDKMSGLDTWYGGVGGSSYINTNTEYTGTNGQVTSSVSYGGHSVDLSTATGGGSTSAILNEVCRELKTPMANGYYAVYVDVKRGSAGYCAWHSYGSCGSTPVQIAFFFNLDGDPGCDPQDTSGLHTQGLAALANVSGHELSEAMTDPRNGGWYDRQGAENGDKCAWTFQSPVSFGGTSWKIQGNWSNAANNNHTGYANGGCIQTSP